MALLDGREEAFVSEPYWLFCAARAVHSGLHPVAAEGRLPYVGREWSSMASAFRRISYRLHLLRVGAASRKQPRHHAVGQGCYGGILAMESVPRSAMYTESSVPRARAVGLRSPLAICCQVSFSSAGLAMPATNDGSQWNSL